MNTYMTTISYKFFVFLVVALLLYIVLYTMLVSDYNFKDRIVVKHCSECGKKTLHTNNKNSKYYKCHDCGKITKYGE